MIPEKVKTDLANFNQLEQLINNPPAQLNNNFICYTKFDDLPEFLREKFIKSETRSGVDNDGRSYHRHFTTDEIYQLGSEITDNETDIKCYYFLSPDIYFMQVVNYELMRDFDGNEVGNVLNGEEFEIVNFTDIPTPILENLKRECEREKMEGV